MLTRWAAIRRPPCRPVAPAVPDELRSFDSLGRARWPLHGEAGVLNVGPVIAERLRVLPASATEGRPIIRRDPSAGGHGPLFFSFGNVALKCGACAFTLMVGLPSADVIRDAVVICPQCAAANESWDPSSAEDGP